MAVKIDFLSLGCSSLTRSKRTYRGRCLVGEPDQHVVHSSFDVPHGPNIAGQTKYEVKHIMRSPAAQHIGSTATGT